MKYKALSIWFWAVLLLGLAGCSPSDSSPQSANTLTIGQIAPNFTLQAKQGAVSLTDFKGKGVVLFFGYTNCPDICPTGLSTLSQALKQLPNNTQQQLQPIFITLDPAVDTPARLAEYLQYFHPNLIGLSSSQHTLKQVTQAYHVIYKRQPQPGSDYDLIQHSAYFYFIAPDGKLSQYLPHQSSVASLKQTLITLMKS